jgi:GNAT superfamily N-acetyltransferase
MITKFEKRHEKSFLELIKGMYDDYQTYCEVSYEYLDRYWYMERYYDSDYIIFVSEDKWGDIDGFIIGQIYKEEIEVLFLFVTPLKRKMNVGTALKIELLQYAKNLGKKEVIAYNLHSNERSLGMNNKLGHHVEVIDDYYYKSVFVL